MGGKIMEETKMERQMSYDERKKELTVKVHNETKHKKGEFVDVWNAEGIKELDKSFKQSKNQTQEAINQTKKMIEELEEKIKKGKKSEEELTPRQKELIEDLKAVKKIEPHENNKIQLKSFQDRLKSLEENQKKQNEEYNEFKKAVKLKLE